MITERDAIMAWLEKTFPGCTFEFFWDRPHGERWVTIRRALPGVMPGRALK